MDTDDEDGGHESRATQQAGGIDGDIDLLEGADHDEADDEADGDEADDDEADDDGANTDVDAADNDADSGPGIAETRGMLRVQGMTSLQTWRTLPFSYSYYCCLTITAAHCDVHQQDHNDFVALVSHC